MKRRTFLSIAGASALAAVPALGLAALPLAVPGMPAGSPGMEMGSRKDPYDVLLIDRRGRASVFATNAGPWRRQ